MPAELLSGFATEEWARFREGVERLNPNDARNVRDEAARRMLAAEYRNIVSIPGWQDIVQLGPRYRPTRDEWRQYYADQRAGRPYSGNRDAGERMADLEDQRKRILGAPDTEMARSWGRILTASDNVQDLVVTLGLIGHLAIWKAPRLLGRFVPVVGSILLVADLFNAITLLGQLATPAYALWCNGPAAALAAGVPALLYGAQLQGKKWVTALASPFSRAGLLRWAPQTITGRGFQTTIGPQQAATRALGPFGRAQALGLAIQAPQVTTSLWGYGVTLGGLVGLITQGATTAVMQSGEAVGGAAAAIQQRRIGDPVTATWPGPNVHIPGLGHELNRRINAPLRNDSIADLLLLQQSAHVMATAPAILRAPELVDAELYASTVAMLMEAQRVVYQRLAGYEWKDLLASALDEELYCPALPSWANEDRFAELELYPGALVPWDMPGNPFAVRGGDYVSHAAPRVADGVSRFCRLHRHNQWGTFVGTAVNQMTDEAWSQLGEGENPIRWEFSLDEKLLTSLTEAARIPTPPDDPAKLWAFWEAARRQGEARRPGLWTGKDWDDLAARYGVTNMRLLPPGSPWPDEWRGMKAGRDSVNNGSSPAPLG